MTVSLPQIERVRPFSNGSQFADWTCANCERCTKNTPPDKGLPTCEVQHAIWKAYMTDGSMSAEMAKRMGFDEPLAYVWQCGEVEWTEEWKAESRRRKTLKYRLRKWCWQKQVAIRKWIQETKNNTRRRWRMPMAEKHGMQSPDTCWAEWCSWAIGYGDEKPPVDSGGGRCREDSIGGSCWCGKFCDGKPPERRL